MPVIFNTRHLEEAELFLKAELPAAELGLATVDELIHLAEPLRYELEVQKLERGILVQGTLRLDLQCECARCLKRYPHQLLLQRWACHLSLEGEERVVISNDCVDLTPYIREDILLSFPQHPLCEPECKGLPIPRHERQNTGNGREPKSASPAWAELNKLKLK